MIEYVLEEASLCWVEEIVVVVSPSKPSLIEYLKDWSRRGRPKVSLVEQPEPEGTGDALWRARELLQDGPFLWMMPDFLLRGQWPAALQILLGLKEGDWDGVTGLAELGPEEIRAFGNVGLVRDGEWLSTKLFRVREITPKVPGPLEGDGRVLKAVGRWVLKPSFFPLLEASRGEGGEWDDTPALIELCRRGRVLGVILEGEAFDLGNLEGYRRANA